MTNDRLVVGCGYLGSRVAKHWRKAGCRVFVTTRNAEHAKDYRELGMEPIVCDVLNPSSLTSLPRAQTVFYGIGLDRSSGQSMRQVYVDGLANVLSALPKPDKFIYVGSASVYGQTNGEWVDEDSPTEPQEESGRICLEAEQLLQRDMPDAVILRFGGIYGPGRLLRQKAIEAGEPIVGNPDKWLNLIYVVDGVRAVVAAEEKGWPGGIYNICENEPVRRLEFFGALARVLGAPEPRFVEPPHGASLAHELANRRISNLRMREELSVEPLFESCRAAGGLYWAGIDVLAKRLHES
jgi:nucleoside-diphosphate-sugar epimerase